MSATRSTLKVAGAFVLLTVVCMTPQPAAARPIEGTPGRDILVGSQDRDRIRGFDGDDAIIARGGVDIARGGVGNDLILLGWPPAPRPSPGTGSPGSR